MARELLLLQSVRLWPGEKSPMADGRCGASEDLWEKLRLFMCRSLPSPTDAFCQVRFQTGVSFQGNVTHMSLIHSCSICKGKGQEAQFDVAACLFFLERERAGFANWEKGKPWNFPSIWKARHKTEEQQSWSPDPVWGHNQDWEDSFLVLLPVRSAVCQMVSAPRMPRTVGNSKLPAYPGGKSAHPPMIMLSYHFRKRWGDS